MWKLRQRLLFRLNAAKWLFPQVFHQTETAFRIHGELHAWKAFLTRALKYTTAGETWCLKRIISEILKSTELMPGGMDIHPKNGHLATINCRPVPTFLF